MKVDWDGLGMLKEWISTEYQKDLLEMKVRGKRPRGRQCIWWIYQERCRHARMGRYRQLETPVQRSTHKCTWIKEQEGTWDLTHIYWNNRLKIQMWQLFLSHGIQWKDDSSHACLMDSILSYLLHLTFRQPNTDLQLHWQASVYLQCNIYSKRACSKEHMDATDWEFCCCADPMAPPSFRCTLSTASRYLTKSSARYRWLYLMSSASLLYRAVGSHILPYPLFYL